MQLFFTMKLYKKEKEKIYLHLDEHIIACTFNFVNRSRHEEGLTLLMPAQLMVNYTNWIFNSRLNANAIL